MNRAWAASLSNFWHSTNWLMWLAIIAAAIVVVVVVVAIFRSEWSLGKSGVLAVSVLAIGIGAFVLMIRGKSPPEQTAMSATSAPEKRPVTAGNNFAFQTPLPALLPALACLDGIAGESVESACERALFATADSTAAAVSYTAAQITRLSSLGGAAAADKIMTPDLKALRRMLERDRYGLAAQVLMTRDGCTSASCPFFGSLTDTVQITGNMNERLYDGLVGRYAPLWNAPAPTPAAPNPPVAALGPPSGPQGKPLSGDFPSASSIPPVNIMTPEPEAQGTQSNPRPPEGAAARAPAPPAAKKKTSAQKLRAQEPTSLAPTRADEDN